MAALVGLIATLCILALILSKRASPMVALIVIPIIAAAILGFPPASIAKYAIDGVKDMSPNIGMFVFAILYFGIMTDAGMMDPIIDRILKFVGLRPARITVGAGFLALIIHLDGSGVVTFLVTVPAMLPLFDRLKMDRRILALVVSLTAGVNFLPWTGPVIRAASSISKVAGYDVTTVDLFRPLIMVQLAGLVTAFGIAYWFGKREERRLNLTGAMSPASELAHYAKEPSDEQKAVRRPHLFWVNIALTIVVLAVMIPGYINPTMIFMVGCVLALLINYPNEKDQNARVGSHAKAALSMATILFAAGSFTGIMSSTKMLSEMALAASNFIPQQMVQHIPFGLALLSTPLTLLFDPDSFYYGVMPIVAEVYKGFGGDPVQIARAAILGQSTTGFPVSPFSAAPFLLAGLVGIPFGEHQRFTLPWLCLASVVMTAAAVVVGIFPL